MKSLATLCQLTYLVGYCVSHLLAVKQPTVGSIVAVQLIYHLIRARTAILPVIEAHQFALGHCPLQGFASQLQLPVAEANQDAVARMYVSENIVSPAVYAIQSARIILLLCQFLRHTLVWHNHVLVYPLCVAYDVVGTCCVLSVLLVADVENAHTVALCSLVVKQYLGYVGCGDTLLVQNLHDNLHCLLLFLVATCNKQH